VKLRGDATGAVAHHGGGRCRERAEHRIHQRVERDETSPSVSTLVTLCPCSLKLGSLFEPPENEVVAPGRCAAHQHGRVGAMEKLLTPRSGLGANCCGQCSNRSGGEKSSHDQL
jgi:hypothetical protein